MESLKKALKRKKPYGVKVTGDGFGVSFTTTVVLSLTTTSAGRCGLGVGCGGEHGEQRRGSEDGNPSHRSDSLWRAGVARVPRQEAAGIYDVRFTSTVKPR